ncbi:unnamed protein product [Echinostoma caproni]|uniref:Peptidase_S9 domain-containing protein n=1 Tax=Echinostoma caproni TaxID=27848 RepID=A0A3P8GFZ0_9TREM|nr:unnamed protein product [Echinostoma caproni]
MQDSKHFGYLTAEQAMADYASLISNLTASYADFQSSAVIAIGGSYGGMLAAWMRMKYPNLVHGQVNLSFFSLLPSVPIVCA